MKRAEECELHGVPAKTANKALLAMVLFSLSLIIWHVWVYGPSGHLAKSEAVTRSFPFLLGSELWDLLFNERGIIAELREVFPYFIVGVLLAGYLRTYKIAVRLQSLLRRYGILSVVLASFVGIITPLCACGTLTTAISLLFAGLPLAPIMALLVTSPLLSPSTYLLTLNDLGAEWTVIRTIAALSMGIFAGLITHFLRNVGFQTNDIFIEGAIVRGDFHDEDYPDERLRCNCKEKFGNRVAVRTDNKFFIFLAKSSEMLWLVGKYILVGVIIGIIVERYIPYEWIYRFFGQKSPLNIVWITLGSVPMFVHQVSASSIIAHVKSSLNCTLDGGAALAFMVGGPVTAVPTMVLFWSVFKKRVFFLYMGVCLLGTILIAFAFQVLVFVPGVDTGNELFRGVGSISGGGSTVIHKQNQHVRIVMDPGGRGIIATYANDLESHGGVVFDSGYERFLSRSADRYDNMKYIGNIAKWIEQNNKTSVKQNILICNASTDNARNAGLLNKRVESDLSAKGFKVRIIGRKEVPELTGRILADYSQLWLFYDETSVKIPMSDGELNAIAKFTDEGKGMLIVAGAFPHDVGEITEANRLASRYGVTFSGFVDNKKELPVAIASNLFNNASEILGRLLKIVHKA